MATGVTFPKTPGGETLMQAGDMFSTDGDVTVRVTHLFHCQIPVAKDIICKSRVNRIWDSIRENSDSPSKDVLALRELKAGTSMPNYLKLLLMSSERFFFLRKEATFPMQGAGYVYQ